MQPMIKDPTGKVVTLLEASPKQCQDMLDFYYERRDLARSASSDLLSQIDYYISMIESRIAAFDNGEVAPPAEKVVKKPFSGLRIKSDKD